MCRRILLIDDDEDVRLLGSLALGTGSEWVVSTASCGQEGLTHAQKDLPDVILLDVNMEGLDGPQTLEQIRQQPWGREIPVIFLTASTQGKKAKELLALGAAGVMEKPFDPGSMSQEILKILGEGQES